MLLKTLKEQMFLPDKEIFLNKHVRIGDLNGILVCITSQNEKNMLWAIYHNINPNKVQYEIPNFLTKKDEMINTITMHNSPNLSLSAITIQEQKNTFSSSQFRYITNDDYESFMYLQHFFENGLSLNYFDNINLLDLIIVSYEFDDSFPHIDTSKELNISLTFNEKIKEALINQTFNLDFKNIESNKRLSFFDPIKKKDRFFYINKLKHYDIWQEAEKQFNSEKMNHLPLEHIKDLKQQYFNNLEETCPKGMNLLLLEYETEDNFQLNFYSKEYLDEPPIHNDSFTVMLFKPDDEIGLNGFTNHICCVKPVPKSFNDTISVELFSFIVIEPKKTITI